jgi:hypothetical protein
METFIFQVEDEFHAELLEGVFSTHESALAEVRRVCEVPFGVAPNCPPCTNWRECHRDYVIKKYRVTPKGEWELLEELPVATTASSGVTWHAA